MTVLQVLQSTTSYFKRRGIEDARLNAEHLLAHALGCKRLDMYLAFERDLSEHELAPLRELVRRRGQGEPLQHLLGSVEFCGNIFLCDKRALVPRPETEQLIEMLQSRIQRANCRILDVGTGAGVIALSLAHRFPGAQIVASDISEEALALARENARRLNLERVQFIRSDLLMNISGRFDVIAANLPYVSEKDRQSLTAEVLCDPGIALFGGEQGDELVRRLIETAPAYLETGGLLGLEIGVGQHAALERLLAHKNYRDIEAKTDYSDVKRFLFARYG